MGLVFDGCTSEDLLVQQRSGWSGTRERLRREDCEFVKHDKLFSKWKVLLLLDLVHVYNSASGLSLGYFTHKRFPESSICDMTHCPGQLYR